jgi:comEA protein
MSILSRWGFTKAEKYSICFLTVVLLVGIFISIYDNHIEGRGIRALSSEDSAAVKKLEACSQRIKANITSDSLSGNNLEGDQERIDINRAGREQLETLPGIGPVLAGEIIRYRDQYGAFSSVDSLLNVPGIGRKKLERIKNIIIIK